MACLKLPNLLLRMEVMRGMSHTAESTAPDGSDAWQVSNCRIIHDEDVYGGGPIKSTTLVVLNYVCNMYMDVEVSELGRTSGPSDQTP